MDTLRRRYIALRAAAPVEPPRLEAAVLAALRRAGVREGADTVKPRLYHLFPGGAIARVDHRSQSQAIAALGGLAVDQVRVETVTTSGTLRQAKRALGVRESARRGGPKRARGRAEQAKR